MDDMPERLEGWVLEHGHTLGPSYKAVNIEYVEWLEAQLAEARTSYDHIAVRYNDQVRQENEHCKDCCCARSWKALGIDHYTGESIPEHIEALRKDAERFAKLERMAQRQKVTINDTGVIPYRVCLNGQVLGNNLREVVDKAIEIGAQPPNSGGSA